MNIMTNDYHWQTNGFYAERRMPYLVDAERQAERRRPVKKAKPAIPPPPAAEGSRLDVRG